MTHSWTARAACRGLDPNLFFPPSRAAAIPAIAVCHSCPVRQACHDAAQDAPHTYGVWGGEYWDHGHPTRRDRTPLKSAGTPGPGSIGHLEAAKRREQALAHYREIRPAYFTNREACAVVAARFDVSAKAVEAWERDSRTASTA